MNRSFDILLGTIGLGLTICFYPLIILLIKIDSRGPIFYLQDRVGKDGNLFKIIKFRTMYVNSEKVSAVTTIMDPRVTKIGDFLRATKLDELPTFINVIKGDMAIVGPRPESPLFVTKYNNAQKKVLTIRPGITDLGTIKYNNEADILGGIDNVENQYVDKILSRKLRYNLFYLNKKGITYDIKIVMLTLLIIIRDLGRYLYKKTK